MGCTTSKPVSNLTPQDFKNKSKSKIISSQNIPKNNANQKSIGQNQNDLNNQCEKNDKIDTKNKEDEAISIPSNNENNSSSELNKHGHKKVKKKKSSRHKKSNNASKSDMKSKQSDNSIPKSEENEEDLSNPNKVDNTQNLDKKCEENNNTKPQIEEDGKNTSICPNNNNNNNQKVDKKRKEGDNLDSKDDGNEEVVSSNSNNNNNNTQKLDKKCEEKDNSNQQTEEKGKNKSSRPKKSDKSPELDNKCKENDNSNSQIEEDGKNLAQTSTNNDTAPKTDKDKSENKSSDSDVNTNQDGPLPDDENQPDIPKDQSNSDDNSSEEYYYYSSSSDNNNDNSLTPEEQARAKIAKDNQKYIEENKPELGKPKFIDESTHKKIDNQLKKMKPQYENTWIYVNKYSTIQAAINCHDYALKQDKPLKICILNFADAFKPGGGYLNGRSPQEETLCRQTLLYPTLIAEESQQLYEKNRNIKNCSINNDLMIYSENVEVIRDDSYEFIEDKFKVNIISCAAIDNRRKHFGNSSKIMERRIRKIIKLAAFEKNDILILGAFGCGIFKNNPNEIAYIFRKILIQENMKDHFQSIWFPIYKSEKNFNVFKKAFTRNKKQ